MKEFVAGFDPGGQGIFGWCVVALDFWRVVDKGVVSYAAEAFGKMQQAMNGGQLSAAGIDAPLYWSQNGLSRKSDNYVRAQYKGVQTINSLQGACFAQGCMLAKKIESECADCLITETHPKALSKISAEAREFGDSTENEHERDALISAWAAKKALEGGGQNLFCLDNRNPKDIHVFLKKTVYWWPKTPT